jgi:RNA polymerase sigma-70 factor (ECF subfamily)
MSSIDERIEDEELRALLPRLRRFALTLTHEPSSADELVRACLERALSRSRSRDRSASRRSWLFALLYGNFLEAQRRGATRWRRLLGALQAEADTHSRVERWIAGSSLAFTRLSVENRAILLMVTVEGFSYQETALVLAIPVASVLPKLSRARQVYRQLAEGMQVISPLRRVK